MCWNVSSTKKLFESYPGSFQRAFRSKYRHAFMEGTPITKGMITKFEASNETYGGKCVVHLQFINKQTGEASPLSCYVLNLNSPTWFENLCIDVKSNDIRCENGTSIANFTRSDFIESGRTCFVFSVLPTTKHVPHKKYREDFDTLFKNWWEGNLQKVLSKLVQVLSQQLEQGTLATFLMNSVLEQRFNFIVYECFGSQTQYKEFGYTCIDNLLQYRCPISKEIVQVTFAHVLAYLQEKICIPVRFIMVTCQKYIQGFISNVNSARHREDMSVGATSAEFAHLFTGLLTPIVEPLYKIDLALKTQIASLLTDRSAYGTNNQREHLKTLMHTQILPQFKKYGPLEGSRDGPDFVDPSMKCVGEIPTSFVFWNVLGKKIHTNDFKKCMGQIAPISTHFISHSIETKTPKNSIVISKGKPGDTSCEHSAVVIPKDTIGYMNQDGNTYYTIPSEFKNQIRLISPYTSHVLDQNNKWYRYQEMFHHASNVSHLLLLE